MKSQEDVIKLIVLSSAKDVLICTLVGLQLTQQQERVPTLLSMASPSSFVKAMILLITSSEKKGREEKSVINV